MKKERHLHLVRNESKRIQLKFIPKRIFSLFEANGEGMEFCICQDCENRFSRLCGKPWIDSFGRTWLVCPNCGGR